MRQELNKSYLIIIIILFLTGESVGRSATRGVLVLDSDSLVIISQGTQMEALPRHETAQTAELPLSVFFSDSMSSVSPYLAIILLGGWMLLMIRNNLRSDRRAATEMKVLKEKLQELTELGKVAKERLLSVEREERMGKNARELADVTDKKTESTAGKLPENAAITHEMFLEQMTMDIVREMDVPLTFISNGISTLKLTICDLISDVSKVDESNTDEYAEKGRKSNHLLRSIEERKNDAIELMDYISGCVCQANNILKKLSVFNDASNAEKESVDLNNCIDNVLIMLRESLVDRIVVKKYYDATLPRLNSSYGALDHVFVNVLLNAVQAIPTESAGVISIYTESRKEEIVIRIHDDGVGIPAAIIGSIFKPFFTSKDESKSSGLGLAISYGIVKDHSGEICIRSTKGKGTEVEITFPITV